MSLQSLLWARIFGAQYQSLSVRNEDIIKSKLESLARATKCESAEEALAEVKQNVRLNTSEPDAWPRILKLQTAYSKLCKRHGWKFLESAPKTAVKHVIEVLLPPSPKTAIEDALQPERSDCKDDFL